MLFVRTPESDQAQQLLDHGWEFSGVCLFSHDKFPYQSFMLVDALELNKTHNIRLTPIVWSDDDYKKQTDMLEELRLSRLDLTTQLIDLQSAIKRFHVEVGL